MIILTDAEKTCDKIQISFHDKNTKKSKKKLGLDRNYFNIINIIYKKPTATIILSEEKGKAFYLRSGRRQDVNFPHYYWI